MVVTCDISFDKNLNATYFAGQFVSGTVILKSDKAKDVKAVVLKISGFAITKWRERRYQRSRQYSGREDYMESKTYLLGSEASNRCTIEAGVHAYNFACKLPENCPTSFEGLHGCIRYVVKVTFVRPWKFDQIYTRGFTVHKMLDLNYEMPQIRVPSNSENYKIFCCGPCKTEPLKLQARLPQTGFVPGQKIPINVLVINNTNIPVAEMRYSLIMLVRYSSQLPMQNGCTERITMIKARGESVLRNCTRSLNTELVVPPTPPTCLRYCNIIRITYQIEVEAKMKGWHGSQVIIMPVIIGNVPLWNVPTVQQQQPRSSQQVEAAFAAVAEDGLSVQPPNVIYPELPPPSYEESTHTLRGDINEDEIHAFGPCEFVPLYPVYNLVAIAQSASTQTGNTKAGYDNKTYETGEL